MTNILGNIVATTRTRVANSQRKFTVTDFESLPGYSGERRSLCRALSGSGINIISEIKKASPSAGLIHPDIDVTSVAGGYEAAGASAISVLTEPTYFGGSLDDLQHVSNAVSIPVLRKDFIVSEYQVHEAKAYGADAILLIVRILERQQIADLYDVAIELGMEVLVELYDREELDLVDTDSVSIVGANNRNLSTMTVDISHSISILKDVPHGIVKVSESGIESSRDLQMLEANGIHAALVGESLMRSKDPASALRVLLDSSQERS